MDPRDAVRLMRPRQWTKNLVVFAALIFSGNLFEAQPFVVSCAAFASFCLVSGAFYSLNDVIDADRDTRHPIKRSRPVASGRISPRVALFVGAAITVVGFALAVFVGLPFAATIAAYGALQLSYLFALKNIAILDMFVIAGCFVLRAVGGALAISVPVSPWLVLCAGLLALFLAAAKRRHEIVLLQGESGSHRPVLAEYSAEMLDSFMVTLSAATISSYALYTFFETDVPHYLMMWTIPFVIYGVLRYQFLVLGKEGGGRPEEVLLSDRPIVVDITFWMMSVVGVLYLAPRFVS